MSTEVKTDNVENAHANAAHPNHRLIYLLPDEITLPDETNVRPWTSKQGETEKEIQDLEALGKSIAEEGQLQPIVVMRAAKPIEGEPEYQIIMGRRRCKAVAMYNLGLEAGAVPKRLECKVMDTVKPGIMFRRAAHENILRIPINPLDFAFDIAQLRSRSKLTGEKNTKRVAEYFAVSPATITQYEKLLGLPEEIQNRVGRNEISREDAFKLSAIADKSGPEAAVKALESGDAAAVAGADMSAGVGMDMDANAGADVETSAQSNIDKGRKKGVGKKKAAAAARSGAIDEAARDADIVVARTRKDILEYFRGQLGPTNGFPDGAIHKFVDQFLTWCEGRLANRTLDKYWDAMVKDAYKGTIASVKEEKPEAEEPPKSAPKKKAAAKKK